MGGKKERIDFWIKIKCIFILPETNMQLNGITWRYHQAFQTDSNNASQTCQKIESFY